MFKKIFSLASLLFVAAPFSALAALDGTKDIVSGVQDIVGALLPLAFAAALLVFFYGVAKFIFRIGGDEKAVSGGRTLMVWGIIALFVISSIWGIVAFIQSDLGISGGGSSTVPFISNENESNDDIYDNDDDTIYDTDDDSDESTRDNGDDGQD